MAANAEASSRVAASKPAPTIGAANAATSTSPASIQYSLTRRLALFANLRNVNDPTDDVEIHGPTTPDDAQFRQRAEFGSLWTVGLKGTF